MHILRVSRSESRPDHQILARDKWKLIDRAGHSRPILVFGSETSNDKQKNGKGKGDPGDDIFNVGAVKHCSGVSG